MSKVPENSVCSKCGCESGLHIHHKDRNHNNNESSNIETLCSLCHSKIHRTTGSISFTKKEVEKLLAACTNLEDEVMVRLAVSTGLRRVDLSRVTIQNIREGGLTFHEHKKDRRKEGQVIEERWRTIPLSPVVVQKIGQLVAALGKEGVKKNEGYLFSWGKSKWGDKTAFNRLQDLCGRAEIPQRPFHALRGTSVKLMQGAGYSPEEVAKITGDTIAVIQQHYMTPTDAELSETVKAKELI